ncbi:MAG: gliding motility-associated-like protein [Saprospiraceae bacterium]|jgi:gliding motility-associated-like protein
MMKRYLLSIILGILSFANYSFGQIELNFSGATGNANGTVDVDITVNGFTDIAGLQYSGAWDSLVMTYNSVVSTNPNLPDLTVNNISGPEGAALDEGQFSFQYNNPNGTGNLDDGEVLFTLRFNLVGEECATTQVSLTGDPTSIEAFDKDFNLLDVTSTSGDIMINGSDCGGGGGDELTITAGMETVGPGGAVCVPITVTNFNDVQSGSGTILWDPTVITYTNLDNIALTGVDGSLNTSNVSNGELKFVWSNPDPANPLTLPDGSIIFEICFTAIGSVGDMSTITLSEAGSLGFEFADDDGTAFPQIVTNGKVTITEDTGPPFMLDVSDVTVNMDSVTGCVDITVANFTNILSMQFVLTWDTDILNNANPTSFMLDGITSNSFLLNQANGSATFSWNDNVGVDLADNSKIFSLCFDLVGECNESSDVQIVSQGTTNIEIVDGNTDEIENVSIDQGSILISCVDPCNVITTVNTCAGSLNGSVTVNVQDGCNYSWTNSSGAVVATTKNLINVGVGVYELTVTCDGVISCTLTTQVNALVGPTVSGSTTNAACGDLGAIDVSVTGGSGNYDYNWNPTQANSPNISNLIPNTYNLTVTDTDSGCTITASFDIENIETEIVINSADVSDETCLEEDGSISLNVSGGCLPYEYMWSNNDIGNTPNAMDLAAGVYGVTVTDNNDNTTFGSYTVDGFIALALVGPPTIIPENMGMGDGAITIAVMGGTMPYSYNWSGPTTGLPSSNTITGLSAGNYTVAVTDALGCDMIFGPFTVLNIDDSDVDPVISNVSVFDAANGFGVICNGDGTASLSATILGATPFTITLGGEKDSVVIKNDLGTFVFDNLSAGSYTLTATNSFGSTNAGTIVVTEPDPIVLTIDKGCDEEEQCDGFIDLNASGGFGDLTYTWSDPDLDGDSADDLCTGNYIVTIKDENGCERMEMIDITPCSPPVPTGCYEVRNVITPNGDGMNETFAVSCINDFPSTLEVYDRWGALVFSQDVYDGSWSGISNSGNELIEGGYMYVIVIDFGQGNRQVMKGTITLLRD